MKKFLIIPLLAASLYVFIQYFSKPDLSQEVAAFNAGLVEDTSDMDPMASLPGKEMRYDDSQRHSLKKEDFLGKGQSKSRYLAQAAKPMINNRLSVNLEDMGVDVNTGGKSPLTQVGRGRELEGYRPSTEQELLLQASKKARNRKSPNKRGSAAIKKFSGGSKGNAMAQLKTASKMGAVALETKDEDAQLLLSRAFVTGENPKKALDKVRRESEGSGSKSSLISGLAGAVIGFLNPGGVFNWSSLISKKTMVTTSYESVNQTKTCEVCGTVSWDSVLAGPQTVGEAAPSRASPYSVELDPKKAPMSLSIQDIQ